MDDFTYLITDDRYAVPTLDFRPAADAAAARTQALADLRDNPLHRRIEVRQGEMLLFTVERADVPTEGQR